jgi:hypothetical protein
MDRYTLILQRRPFSESSKALAAADTPAIVTVAKPPAFVSGIRPCSFVETERGLRVGFEDSRQKPPEIYSLYVGESREGVVLVDADFEGEAALLRKGGEQYWLGTSDATSATSASAAIENQPREAKPLRLSFSERRQLRLEELKKRAEARRQTDAERSAQLSDDELEKRLQEYQMELIRAGKTPLPMVPLTPEMDAQLVEEGILPPQEN